MNALLTDEAVTHVDGYYGMPPRYVARALLRHHATVGREALVEKVADAMRGNPCRREDAEAVVTALVGAAPMEAKQP